MCKTLESAARLNDLPVAFLTRLIWQESRFDAYVVSPAGARGVAQFMPETAAGRGLANPFDVTDAINKSAEFLRDLTKQFGNLGLAAAAYNAGPKRVQDWLAGSGSLPLETEAYVRITTGHGANDWRSAQPNQWTLMLPEAIPCPQLVKILADNPERIAPRGKAASARVAPSAEAVWGVQLIGDDSQASALAEYSQMQKTYKSVLGGHQPLVLRSKVGRSGFWYRVRVPADNIFQAERLCSDLRAAGGSCLVQRN
ncbi:MAG: lytic transglycosylase domain-containing protein [Roseiarcus sp.]